MELPGFLLPERRLRDMAMKSLQQECIQEQLFYTAHRKYGGSLPMHVHALSISYILKHL